MPMEPMEGQPLALAWVMSVSTTLTHNKASSLFDKEVECSDDDDDNDDVDNDDDDDDDDDTEATAVLDEEDFDWD